MDDYATLRCVLRVHPRCHSCKRHTSEILGSIIGNEIFMFVINIIFRFCRNPSHNNYLQGTYDITMDAEKGEETIVGQVEPNYCLRAITRCNGHAELVWANLSHPRMRGQSYGYGGYRDSYDPPAYPIRTIPDYSYTPNNINYDYEYDRRRRGRDPYGIDTMPYYNEESMSLCTIL